MAVAVMGGLPGRPEQQFRRFRQRRRTRGRQHHGRLLLVALREKIRLGASRHCRHRVEGRQGKGRNGTPRSSARDMVAFAGGQRARTVAREAMTTIDFYTHVADRLAVAARIVAKAYAARGSVRVLTPDRATTDALDRLLWLQTALSFLPHCRMASVLAADTPIWVGATAQRNGPCAGRANPT